MSWVIAVLIVVFLGLVSVAFTGLAIEHPKVLFTILIGPMVLALVFMTHVIVEKGLVLQ